MTGLRPSIVRCVAVTDEALLWLRRTAESVRGPKTGQHHVVVVGSPLMAGCGNLCEGAQAVVPGRDASTPGACRLCERRRRAGNSERRKAQYD